MSKQVQDIETIFCHEVGLDYLVVVSRDGKRLFRAKLGLSETNAGPRPAKFRLKRGSTEEPRQSDEFIELARRAERIRISEQTSPQGRAEIQEMLFISESFGESRKMFEDGVIASLRDHSIGSELTAVREDYVSADRRSTRDRSTTCSSSSRPLAMSIPITSTANCLVAGA